MHTSVSRFLVLIAVAISLLACSKDSSEQQLQNVNKSDEVSQTSIANNEVYGIYQRYINVLGEQWQAQTEVILELTDKQIKIGNKVMVVAKWEVSQDKIKAFGEQQEELLDLQLQQDFWLDKNSNGLYAYKKI